MVRSPSIDKNGIKKGQWSKEEDDKLKNYINRYGTWNWRQLPRFAGLSRCGKSCRLRWKNYLQPNVKRGNYTKEEEDIIINLHQQLGKKWSVIAKKLPGRTDNEIKNYWHTHLKKGQHQISLPSNQEKMELSKDENNRELYQSDDQQQISTPCSQGLTSPNESFCTELSQSYSDATLSDLLSWVQKDDVDAKSIESSADFLSQKLKIEDFESPQGSYCSKVSFSCTNTPTCLDDFWSLPFETDNYMINAYKNQQPLVDVYPSSPFTEEVFLWSY